MDRKETSTVLVSCSFDRDDPGNAVVLIGRPSLKGAPEIVNVVGGKEAIELWDSITKIKPAK